MAAAGARGAETDWPQWQGPRRDNRSPDTGLLRQWPEAGPNLLWKRPGIGQKGFSSVAIADGMIYTTGIKDDRQLHIAALDMDGNVKWTAQNGPGFLATHGGSRATPTIRDGLLYLLSGTGRLACFDAKTGEEKWAVQITERFGGKVPTWGYAESVLVDGDRVICTPGGPKAAVAALHRKTGATIWTAADSSDQASYCAPIVFEVGGVRQIATLTATEALGIQADTGKVLWRVSHKVSYDVHATTPVFHDGALYMTAGYGVGGFRIDVAVKDGAVTVTKKWSDRNLDNHHGGVVLVDGFIYGYGDRGGWTCLDFGTGEAKWTSKALGKGSITYADGMLYCYTEGNGTMALVKASPEAFQEVSRFVVPKGGIREYWAHPVVVGGRLYVRHSDVLYCYDVTAGREVSAEVLSQTPIAP